MPTRFTLAAILIAAFAAACGPKADTDYKAEIETWHAERIAGLLSDTGWLTLVGLHRLADGENVIGTAPGVDIVLDGTAPDTVGVIDVGPESVLFTAAPDVDVRYQACTEVSLPVEETIIMHTDRDGQPLVLTTGTLLFHVIDRAGELYLRVKDRHSAVLKNFTGIARFPVDKRWRVAARLEGEPGTVTIPDALGHDNKRSTPGVLVFELDGLERRLIPEGEPGGEMFLVFGDATNGITTYGAGRFLTVDAVDTDGRTVLDFNKAYNPPCAFTDFATCPMPPPENILPLPVEAGEKAWGGHH